MSAAGFTVVTAGAIALVAATPKTILGCKAPTNQINTLVDYGVSFDGVDATKVPVLVEVCRVTFATNAPGTASTTATPQVVRGAQGTSVSTCARNWTTEPTVISVVREYMLSPNGGLIIMQQPLGRESESPVSGGLCIRLTAPLAVNVRGFLEWEE